MRLHGAPSQEGRVPAPARWSSGRQPPAVKSCWALSQLRRATNTRWHPLLSSCIQWLVGWIKDPSHLPPTSHNLEGFTPLSEHPVGWPRLFPLRPHRSLASHPAHCCFLFPPFHQCWSQQSPKESPARWFLSQRLLPGEPSLYTRRMGTSLIETRELKLMLLWE